MLWNLTSCRKLWVSSQMNRTYLKRIQTLMSVDDLIDGLLKRLENEGILVS